MIGAGFPTPIVIRTLMALDAHTSGSTLQEQAWPFLSEMAPDVAVAVADDLPDDTNPNVASMIGFVTSTRPGSLMDFEFGLDSLLDGLDHRLGGS